MAAEGSHTFRKPSPLADDAGACGAAYSCTDGSLTDNMTARKLHSAHSTRHACVARRLTTNRCMLSRGPRDARVPLPRGASPNTDARRHSKNSAHTIAHTLTHTITDRQRATRRVTHGPPAARMYGETATHVRPPMLPLSVVAVWSVIIWTPSGVACVQSLRLSLSLQGNLAHRY